MESKRRPLYLVDAFAPPLARAARGRIAAVQVVPVSAARVQQQA
jgi:hypothetical protein